MEKKKINIIMEFAGKTVDDESVKVYMYLGDGKTTLNGRELTTDEVEALDRSSMTEITLNI